MQTTALGAALMRQRLPGLDALRAIAVTMVFLYHFGFAAAPGGYGVVLFFVLSGFLITWHLIAEYGKTGTVSLKVFYLRRFLRITPALLAYWCFLVTALTLAGKSIPWPHALSALTYTSNYFHAVLGDPNDGFSHTWSLSIEEQFYLTWPSLFLLALRRGRGLATLLTGTIAVLWLYRAALVLVFGVRQHYIYASFETRADALLVGCLLAVLASQPRTLAALTSVTKHPAAMVIAIGAAAVVALPSGFGIPRFRDVFGFALFPLLAAVVILQAMAFSSTRLWAWMEHPAVQYVGRLSYSLYLWQQITIGIGRKLSAGLPVAVQLIVAIVVTFVAAAMSFHWIEKPILELSRRRVRRSLPVATLSR